MDPLRWLANDYFDLNGLHVDVLEKPPTALEFSRLVHISRPVLIKGFKIAANSNLWTNEYLIERMGSRPISIAVTPNGRADAITTGPNNKLYFTEPCVEQMTMPDFLAKLSGNASHPQEGQSYDCETYYLQSQNGNLYSSRFFDGHDDGSSSPEFEPLRRDVPSEIPWCSQPLDRTPDAVNLWIGDGSSVSSIHSDPYENLYTVVRGEKSFTLLPPTEGWCLNERVYPYASYVRDPASSKLRLQLSAEETRVRWSSITDPNIPGALCDSAHPIHIVVKPGETLYLPAGWWHYVQQTGITVALNWWYDMEMRGPSWALLGFLRNMKDVPDGNEEEEVTTNETAQ
ncbi:Clavaminate synthase-like protein [Dendrothele bispora CBS 962.96]|uniref:Clavaminate synthase-like protein n=1 Tax=Dendrothele bispora (strain CBS 962.96) TaxID=1314807 RepID=A0A4S8MZG3_DENBC|nr:Clavaminate synthase-like protein [Dendrothele bispora CBS 962.96]